jgi:HAD superfamily hydrolase (TIGR01662 family)
MARRLSIVLIDLGSTLFYFDGDWKAALKKSAYVLADALQYQGFDLDKELFISVFEKHREKRFGERKRTLRESSMQSVVVETLEKLGHQIAGRSEGLLSAIEKMYEVTETIWQVETDAAETLAVLRSQGFRIGLVSNASDDGNVQRLLHKTELRSYFDVVITSDAVGYRKPTPLIFMAALSHFQAQPDEAVMIGDRLDADIMGANQLGIRSIWITRRVSPGESPEQISSTARPDATVATLAELPALLQDMADSAEQ